jgi:hypothetical protein
MAASLCPLQINTTERNFTPYCGPVIPLVLIYCKSLKFLHIALQSHLNLWKYLIDIENSQSYSFIAITLCKVCGNFNVLPKLHCLCHNRHVRYGGVLHNSSQAGFFFCCAISRAKSLGTCEL